MDLHPTPKPASTAHLVWRSCVRVVTGLVGSPPRISSTITSERITTRGDGETVGSILRARLTPEEFAALSVRDTQGANGRR